MASGSMICAFVGKGRADRLRSYAGQVDLGMAELLRRLLDHGLRPSVLNEMAPNLSGQIKVVKG